MTNNDVTSPPSSSTSPPSIPSSDNRRAVIGVWIIAFAALLLSCGACSALFYLITPLTARPNAETLAGNTLFGASALLGGLFGVVLVWQGVQFLRAHTPRPAARVFPRVTLWVIAFLLTILCGIAALATKPAAAYLFPPWHFFASILPPLIFVAYAARRLGGQSGFRALFASISWGGLGAVPLALIAEIVLGIVVLFIVAILIVASPEGRALIDPAQIDLLLEQTTPDLATLTRLVTNPAIVIGFLAFFALAVPVIEEALKTLVVAFSDPRRTSLANAVLWGIGAGAGFAAVENIFNVNVELSMWAITMLLRVGAATMHVATGVTMGYGWYAARVERRWGRLILAYLVCVFFHAAWNASAIVIGGGALFFLSEGDAVRAGLPWLMLIAGLVITLVILAFSGLVWIGYAIRAVREPEMKGVN